MATNYKIRLKRFNGTDYDTLNLISDNIIMSSGNNLQTDFNGLDSAIDDIVYVGDSEPTDPDVKIWLDTDASGASAVNSVNGKAGTVVLDAEDVGAMSKWELLWTNASPTSAFAAQTLSVDTSDYSFIAVEFRTHINVDNYLVSIMRTGTKSGFGVMVMGGFFNPSSQANANGYTREVDLTSSSSIGISGSFYASSGTSWKSTASTNELIPTNIWGIKGEIAT